MKAPLYQEVLDLCQAMAEASAVENETDYLTAHQSLQKLCQTNQNTPKDHPLQWEALADFTHDGDQALDIYQLALNCAEKLSMVDSQASVLLAIAQRYDEFEEYDKAKEFAEQANAFAEKINSNELKIEISDFISKLSV